MNPASKAGSLRSMPGAPTVCDRPPVPSRPTRRPSVERPTAAATAAPSWRQRCSVGSGGKMLLMMIGTMATSAPMPSCASGSVVP
jgi:hypothetical protein